MAAIYAALIKKGLKKIEDVPKIIRDAVEKILYGNNEMEKSHNEL